MVSIGNFDGVHVGHRALLARVVERARAAHRPALAYTFDPLPAEVLAPDRCPPRIQSLDARLDALRSSGVDIVVVERFDAAFAAHEPEWFTRCVLQDRLGASEVIVGWNFRFGAGRRGGIDELRAGTPFPVEAFGPYRLGDEVVSSSRVRELLRSGDVVAAARLLGRPHRIDGGVVRGDGRARGLGFPTANLDCGAALLPAFGVYAVRVGIEGRLADGVVNIGVRPTFNAGHSVEAHLLDFDGDLYGARLTVEFIERIRGEQRFSGVESLVRQIGEDIQAARRLLAGVG